MLGTIEVLEAARVVGARRVVNTSTGGGLYGDADVIPTPEDHPIRPLAPYGQGKYAAEGYCGLYTRLHGLSTVSLRYGNVYGPARTCTARRAWSRSSAGGCRGRGGRRCSGTGVRRAIGSTSSDVVRVNLLAAESVTGAINIGNGRETSVLEFLGALNEVSDRDRCRSGDSRRSAPARCGAAAST